MTVTEIVIEYLRAHSMDGLCLPDLECGCQIHDLAPCGACCMDCHAGVAFKDEYGSTIIVLPESIEDAK